MYFSLQRMHRYSLLFPHVSSRATQPGFLRYLNLLAKSWAVRDTKCFFAYFKPHLNLCVKSLSPNMGELSERTEHLLFNATHPCPQQEGRAGHTSVTFFCTGDGMGLFSVLSASLSLLLPSVLALVMLVPLAWRSFFFSSLAWFWCL